MNYIDTSVLVAALATEKHSTRAERWLTTAAPDELAISDWVVAEFSSALSIKLRTGQIEVEGRTAALGAFAALIARSLVVLPIGSSHFRTAARFADLHRLGLRAADALHLAVAAGEGATLCTLDKRLAAAAKALNIAARLV